MATTVDKLHPGHVSLVMAMGDSITAAFAARGFLNEDRDISWSAGQGLDSQVTLPYMLNQYEGPIRPVQGMSTKAVLPNNISHLPHGDYHPATDHFNFAESSGAVHRNSLEEQWAYVLQHMNDFPYVQERWKVFTLWMTANDVCGECNGPMDIVQWSARTQQLLLNITNTFKNIYVNLVGTLDLSNVARIQRADLFCKIEHSVLKECGCIDRGNSSQLLQLDENVHKVNAELHRIAQKFTTMLQQQGRTDMAVVMQGFQEGVGKTLTRKFLSNLDCFHPSTTGHQDLAIGLWNNMLCTGPGRADLCGSRFSEDMKVVCPTEQSVFYTGPDVTPNPPSGHH